METRGSDEDRIIPRGVNNGALGNAFWRWKNAISVTALEFNSGASSVFEISRQDCFAIKRGLNLARWTHFQMRGRVPGYGSIRLYLRGPNRAGRVAFESLVTTTDFRLLLQEARCRGGSRNPVDFSLTPMSDAHHRHHTLERASHYQKLFAKQGENVECDAITFQEAVIDGKRDAELDDQWKPQTDCETS